MMSMNVEFLKFIIQRMISSTVQYLQYVTHFWMGKGVRILLTLKRISKKSYLKDHRSF